MSLPSISTASTNGARTAHPGFGSAYSVDGGGSSGVSEIVPASITTGSMNPTLIQVAQINLTAAQIQALNATPVTLIAAPGVGKSILVDYVLLRFTAGGTQFTGGGAVSVQYNGGAAIAATLAATVIQSASSSDTILGNLAANLTATQNAAITISNATGAFAAGNGTLAVYVYYSVV